MNYCTDWLLNACDLQYITLLLAGYHGVNCEYCTK